MVIHVCIKRYTDGSGFYVMGATKEDAVAQAFVAGGSDGAAVSEVYSVDPEVSFHVLPNHVANNTEEFK